MSYSTHGIHQQPSVFTSKTTYSSWIQNIGFPCRPIFYDENNRNMKRWNRNLLSPLTPIIQIFFNKTENVKEILFLFLFVSYPKNCSIIFSLKTKVLERQPKTTYTCVICRMFSINKDFELYIFWLPVILKISCTG